jgi:hypothetical protein
VQLQLEYKRDGVDVAGWMHQSSRNAGSIIVAFHKTSIFSKRIVSEGVFHSDRQLILS